MVAFFFEHTKQQCAHQGKIQGASYRAGSNGTGSCNAANKFPVYKTRDSSGGSANEINDIFEDPALHCTNLCKTGGLAVSIT